MGKGQPRQRRRKETLDDAGQSRILEMIAAGAPVGETLRALCRLIEAGSPGMLASILLLDDDGERVRYGGATRALEAYCRAIDGLRIGPRAGSCGTAPSI